MNFGVSILSKTKMFSLLLLQQEVSDTWKLKQTILDLQSELDQVRQISDSTELKIASAIDKVKTEFVMSISKLRIEMDDFAERIKRDSKYLDTGLAELED